MDDSTATKGRLPAALSFLLGCVGLGWILMVVQTSAGCDADAAGGRRERVKMTTAVETAPVPARRDGGGQRLAAVAGRED